MRYGITKFAPAIFGGPPALAVAGPNVGLNAGLTVLFSGTVGATVEAVNQGIPGIAFSGDSGSQVGYTTPVEPYQTT
jgi:5'-nucleotidase